jgi:cell division protein FtsB
MPPASPEPLRRRSRTPVAAPSRWRSRLLQYALAFVAIVLVVDALVGEKGLVDTLRARRQYREAATALAQKRQENARLREDIRRLREDPSRIESVAREELGLIRPGEVLFIITDANAQKK